MAVEQPQSTDTMNSPDHAALHRIIAASTSANVQSVAVQDDGIVRIGDTTGTNYTQIENDGTVAFKGNATVWNDLRFPFIGKNVDISTGRIDYNYFNSAIGFQNTARYPNEPMNMLAQLPHEWKVASTLYPHVHWIQQSSNIPNWLLAYKIVEKGASVTIDIDYTNYTLNSWNNNVYTYTSGNIHQITKFPSIDMTGFGISDCIELVFFRDTLNTSGQFTGADPSSSTEYVWEFDIHYEIDTCGSRQEYVK